MALFSPHLPDRTLADFFQRFAQVLRSGLPLTQGFRLLVEGTKHRGLRRRLEEALEDIERNRPLREAIERAGRMFPPMAYELIGAGEVSGMLDRVAAQLADHFDFRHKLKMSILASLIYPAALFLMAIHVPFFVKWVVGTFQGTDTGAWKYLLTWYAFLGGAFALALVASHSMPLRRVLSHVAWVVPGLSSYVQLIAVSNFTQAFTLLGEAGLGFDEAVERAADASGSPAFARRVKPAAEDIRRGDSLLEALSRTGVFGQQYLLVLHNGEQSGELTATLRRLAEQHREKTRTVSQWIGRVACGAIYGAVMLYVVYLILSMAGGYYGAIRDAADF